MNAHPDWIPIIAFGVFFVAPVALFIVAIIVARVQARKRPTGDETGDPMNPQALSEWRKANSEAFK